MDMQKLYYYEPTGIEEQEVSQTFLSLLQNCHNPFKSSTTISFFLHRKDTENAEIKIYNIKGRLIRTLTLHHSTIHQSLLTNVLWNGKDDKGIVQNTGIYFYALTLNGKVECVNKMIILVKPSSSVRQLADGGGKLHPS